MDKSQEEVNRSEVEHQHPQRKRQPPVRYGQDEYADMATVQDYVHHVAYNMYTCQILQPKSLEETLTIEHAKQWKVAADSEYESIMKNETYQLAVNHLIASGCLRLSMTVMARWNVARIVWLALIVMRHSLLLFDSLLFEHY